MSQQPKTEQPSYAEFGDGGCNYEVSSDDGGASNSDAEPETGYTDSDEDSTPDTIETSGRAERKNWQETIARNGQNLSRGCSLTRKSEQVETIDDCFHLFINDRIIDRIVLYTNMKAASENKSWKPVDREEMDAFFGLLLLMGRFRESRESKADLWKENEALSRRYYAAVMSRNRFTTILKYIRFDDSETRRERKSFDKLAPLRDITDMFTSNCKDSYNPGPTGCLDEQLIAFRGRCSFKVYMPSKPGRYGIKIWTLCDSENFYCCNMDVYLGRQAKDQVKRVVNRLVDHWNGSRRSVTMDNFLTEPGLALELSRKSIYTVGTVRKSKMDIPKTFIDTRNRELYSSEFLFANGTTLVSYIPRPRKCVVLLSTLQQTSKSDDLGIIDYYNSTKRGVDILDNTLREYSCRRCTTRWPLSLFMHYLDVAAYNAFVIWQRKHPAWSDQGSFEGRRRKFLEELSCKLTAKNIDRRATEFENGRIGMHKCLVNAIQATGRRITKRVKLATQSRARCCFCIGSNNRYSSKCDVCSRHVCADHSVQSRKIVCTDCYEMHTDSE